MIILIIIIITILNTNLYIELFSVWICGSFNCPFFSLPPKMSDTAFHRMVEMCTILWWKRKEPMFSRFWRLLSIVSSSIPGVHGGVDFPTHLNTFTIVQIGPHSQLHRDSLQLWSFTSKLSRHWKEGRELKLVLLWKGSDRAMVMVRV